MKPFDNDAEAVARQHARQAFVAAATALAVLFMGNNLPSALYGVFRAAFGYSSLTQTLLYAGLGICPDSHHQRWSADSQEGEDRYLLGHQGKFTDH